MSKVREIFAIIIFGIINAIIALSITGLLEVSNVVVFRTYTATFGDITWEVIIFFALSLFEATIYELYNKKYISEHK